VAVLIGARHAWTKPRFLAALGMTPPRNEQSAGAATKGELRAGVCEVFHVEHFRKWIETKGKTFREPDRGLGRKCSTWNSPITHWNPRTGDTKSRQGRFGADGLTPKGVSYTFCEEVFHMEQSDGKWGLLEANTH